MADNKVTIDAEWFAELYAAKKDKEQYAEALSNIAKERDELKAKLSTSQNYEAVIAAKDREIEAVKEERNRLNSKVNELKAKFEKLNTAFVNNENVYLDVRKRLAAAEQCIEEIEGFYRPENNNDPVIRRIRAYREKEAK